MKSHQRPALTNEHVQLGLMRANINSEPQLNAIPHSHEMYTTKKKACMQSSCMQSSLLQFEFSKKNILESLFCYLSTYITSSVLPIGLQSLKYFLSDPSHYVGPSSRLNIVKGWVIVDKKLNKAVPLAFT